MRRLFPALIALTVILSSCFLDGGKRLRGSGTIKTDVRNEKGFQNIEVQGAIKVFVRQDSGYAVKVEADDNLQDHIEVYVDKQTLVIRPEKGFNLRPTRSIKVYVSGPSFRDFDISGASSIRSDNRLSGQDELSIELSGASEAEVDVKCPKVSIDASGASTATLNGETKDLQISNTGASSAKCYQLLTENAVVEVSGASHAEVAASVKLDANASGASNIRYKGNAALTQDVSGAGSVKKVD
ncbi:MAG: head GIN domain-containing protein [Chitinophagaceae bacterium]